jgi:hypothetical protein
MRRRSKYQYSKLYMRLGLITEFQNTKDKNGQNKRKIDNSK